jgi:TDG/mug DNA glycosylase family protein
VAKLRLKDTSGAASSRPTPTELELAVHGSLRDLVAPDLNILFCGINPGRYSTAAGHHFAGPGNRFWPTLYAAGFTPRLLRPSEDADLLRLGYGITNLVGRTTATADLLTKQELLEGARILRRKVRRLEPSILAFVGLGAYRTAFDRPAAVCGLQDLVIGATRVWLLPNPSGLNAHHQGPALVALFRSLRQFAGAVQEST